MKMKFTVSKEDLYVLDLTKQELIEGIAEKLNNGIDIDHGESGTIYLTNLDIEIEVVG